MNSVKNNDDNKINFSYFAVALIDILNQREELTKLNKLPENEEELQYFIQQAKNSYGAVKGLRSTFDSFFNAYIIEEPRKTDGLSQDQISLLKRMLKTEIKKQQFSDTMIFYTSLEENPDFIPINGILGLFLALSATLIMALSIGKIFRGGIDVGIASCNCFEGEELYGPALYNAYDLESKHAQYPRVVIGNEIRNYILGECRLPENDVISSYRKFIAEKCRKMICVDLDGLQILDYLGGSIKDMFSESSAGLNEPIKNALHFVNKEYENFRKKQNTRLANRYFMLRYYMLDRINKFWG